MTTDNKPADAASTPPWGDEFDAQRAWDTITALRGEVKTLKGAVANAEEERDSAFSERDAAKAIADEAEAKITAATEEHGKALTAAQRDLYIERAVRKFGLDEDLVDFITGDDEESILAKAERLSKVGTPPAPSSDPDPTANPAVKPEPALLPGHGGAAPEPFDPAAVAAAARANR